MAHQLTRAEALDWIEARPRTAKLATVLADGGPHVAPVWVARDGDRLRFTTHESSLKAAALRRDPRVALCFDDETPPFAFVLVLGTIELSTDADELLRWATTIGGRYMGAERAEEYGRRNGVEGELLVTVTPTRVRGTTGVAD